MFTFMALELSEVLSSLSIASGTDGSIAVNDLIEVIELRLVGADGLDIDPLLSPVPFLSPT